MNTEQLGGTGLVPARSIKGLLNRLLTELCQIKAWQATAAHRIFDGSRSHRQLRLNLQHIRLLDHMR